jgi:hypothetical protein
MADDVSHFYFYDSTTLTDSDLARSYNLFVTQNLARASTASLGECEAYLDGSMLIDNEVFAEAAAQGQTVFASSGDTGAACAVQDTNGVPAGDNGLYPEIPRYNYDTGLGTFDTAAMMSAIARFVPAMTQTR